MCRDAEYQVIKLNEKGEVVEHKTVGTLYNVSPRLEKTKVKGLHGYTVASFKKLFDNRLITDIYRGGYIHFSGMENIPDINDFTIITTRPKLWEWGQY